MLHAGSHGDRLKVAEHPNHIVLHLQQATSYERVDAVSSFIGEDSSGSFGILPGHERLMTTLVFGLAKFRVENQAWQYLALPGGVFYFQDNQIFLSTRRIFRDESYERISTYLEDELLREERNLQSMKLSLQRMEDEILKRLRGVGRADEVIL